MDIYENIVIGNFLFGLGLEMGKEVPPISVNLLQQTPLDRPLGDVLIAKAHFVRVVEFKRVANDSDKEQLKLRSIQRALSANIDRRLATISRKIHWYLASEVSASAEDKMRFRVRIAPYLDFDFDTGGKWTNLRTFICETASAAIHSMLSDEEILACERYVNLLMGIAESTAASSGALIIWRTDANEIRHLAVPSIHDLHLTFRQLEERDRAQELDRGLRRRGPSLER